MTVARRVLVLVIALAATAARGAEPGWDEYSAGVAHVKAGRFAEGRDALLQALAKKPEEGRFKVGVRFFDYYPSHFLAEAYLGLGKVEEAERSLRTAEGVKKVTADETSALAQLRARVDAAKGRTEAPPPAAARAEPAAAKARAALSAGDPAKARLLAEQALEADPGDAAAREVLDEIGRLVQAKVGGARDAMRSGNLEAARASLREALAIDKSSSAAGSLVTAVEGQSAKAAQELASADAALVAGDCERAGRLAASAGRLDGSLAASAASLQRQAREACRGAGTSPAPSPPPESVPPGEVSPPAEAPTESPVVAAPEPPPPELQAALRSYFAGDVDACVETLEPLVRRGNARGDVLAALATAHATRGFLEGQGTGSGNVERARELFARALTASPGLQLDRRFFSPKVVRLLEDARAEKR